MKKKPASPVLRAGKAGFSFMAATDLFSDKLRPLRLRGLLAGLAPTWIQEPDRAYRQTL